MVNFMLCVFYYNFLKLLKAYIICYLTTPVSMGLVSSIKHSIFVAK